MLGLIGAHRVGKTTLARAWAEKNKGIFLETPTSRIFTELGHDPSDTFEFRTRMDIQETILARFEDVYAEASLTVPVITDRTPIDMLGYTLAEAVGNHVPEDQIERLMKYINRCFELTNERFSMVVLVQPGIPIIDAPGKAAPNKALIEHLNALMLGFIADPRLKVPHFYLQRYITDLEGRLQSLERAQTRTFDGQMVEVVDFLNAGGRPH